MKDLSQVLKEGLYGEGTHIDTLKGLSDLTNSQALEKSIKDSHSSYEILFHMVYWQDILIKGLSESKYYSEKFAKTNWPTEQDYEKLKWMDLVEHFKEGLKIAEILFTKIDLNKDIPEANGDPALKPITVLLQHNSFHLGQIVQVRKAQNSWNF